MTQLKRTGGDVVRTPPAEGQPTVIHATQHVHYHQAPHWIATFAQLHPGAQIALAIGAGVGLPIVLYTMGGLLTGLASFALAAMTIFSQFVITIGAGVGILLIVVIGITGILKL